MEVATLEPSTAGANKRSMGEWLHVTILTVLGNGSTINVLDLLVNHVANGIVVTYVRIITESVIIESVCSLIKKAS